MDLWTVGVVIRNHADEFVAAANDTLDLVTDIMMAEASVMLLGMELAISWGCSRVVFNCDNTSVIEILNRGERSYGPATEIFEDCFCPMKEFVMISFEHYGRRSNEVAHELARQARFSPVGSWVDSPPLCIFPLLLNDVTLITNHQQGGFLL